MILEKGQQVTLNVHNQLSDTTTTHWHGLHLAAINDGSPHNVILPGETWSPSFTVLDNAATYWYHPHLHGKTMHQVIKGAAGLIIVRDSVEAALNLPRNYGVDDIPLICQFTTFDNNTKQIVLEDELDNTLLVNGIIGGMVNLPAQVVRLRLLNASSHRVFRFGFTNNLTFMQIATDGGLLNAPVALTRLNLSSGERAEILVNLQGMEGQTLYLRTFGNELQAGVPGGPAMMGMPIGPLDNTTSNVLQINVLAPTNNPVTTIPTYLTTNTVWSQTGATTRNISMTAQPMMSMSNFFINGAKYDEEVINFTTEQEKTEIWRLFNQTMMAHPFHIHGNSFYILDINGAVPPEIMRGKKDVVLVPPMGGSVRLITKYEDFSDPHMPYMYHCHILSHEDNGMMGQFIVNPISSSIEEPPKDESVRLFPNPATCNSNLWVEADSDLLSLDVFDTQGSLISTIVFTPAKQQMIRKNLINGTYVFRFRTTNGQNIQKVIFHSN